MDKVGLEHVVIDNKEDGLFRVHRRYFDFVLQMGVDQDAVRNRRPGVAKALGNGHAVIQIQPLGGRPIATWALGPKDESPENRTLRLDNFLTFLGPGGYATPDDVEALESCQRGFANREVAWSDISRGMKRDQPVNTDELQMRAFWRQWHASMTQAPPARATVRPAVAVS